MTLRRGASGETVVRIQHRLRELGLYLGPVDGNYGGGTEGAVKSLQSRSALAIDGHVGSATWEILFPDQPQPQSQMLAKAVAFRCLALTGSFETSTNPPDCFSGISGDFDGQGLSLGALQWNLGQGTLQSLLTRMLDLHPNICASIFHEHVATLRTLLKASRARQLEFARSLQDQRHNMFEPWRGMLKTLGRTEEFRAIQVSQASTIYDRAVAMTREYQLTTERAVALMFDILVQNGSITSNIKSQIFRDYAALDAQTGSALEVARMRVIAKRRAAGAKAQFAKDVLTRKLTIAEGSGVVHGLPYDLEEQFGLRLIPLASATGM